MSGIFILSSKWVWKVPVYCRPAEVCWKMRNTWILRRQCCLGAAALIEVALIEVFSQEGKGELSTAMLRVKHWAQHWILWKRKSLVKKMLQRHRFTFYKARRRRDLLRLSGHETGSKWQRKRLHVCVYVTAVSYVYMHAHVHSLYTHKYKPISGFC